MLPVKSLMRFRWLLAVGLLLSCCSGCWLITPWNETGVVTPSGVHTTTITATQVTVSPRATPVATSTTTAEPSPAPSPEPSTTTTTIQQTHPTTRPTIDLNQLNRIDNSKAGWYYQPASPLGQDRPAGLPAAVLQLIDPYAVIWQEQHPAGKPLYLTFDQGYEYKNLTDTILDVAQAKQVPIAFFVTGSYLRRNPERVQRMAEDGHQVLNHTDTHPNLVDLLDLKGPDAVLAELHRVEEAYTTLTGRSMPPVMRPPEGSYSERLLALLDQSGYQTAFWSFAYRDWLTDDQPDPAQALQKILDNLHPGSVILLHAVSETNVAILPDLIDAARDRGYTFRPLRLD